MKTATFSITARVAIGTLFFFSAVVFVLLALFSTRAPSATPPNGSISVTTSTSLMWTGTAPGTGAANGESSCVEGVNCDSFTLTVNGTPADWANASKRVEIKIKPPSTQDDYDLVIHKTDLNGKIVDSSGNGAGADETAHITPSTDGVGPYLLHL